MTFYQEQVERIRSTHYKNQKHLDCIRQARQLMCETMHEELNLDYIAAQVFLSKFHFLKVFKRYYGQTPAQHLTDLRIERAKVLIGQGYSFQDISIETGWHSAASFSTAFRMKTGKSPSEFKKSNFHKVPDARFSHL